MRATILESTIENLQDIYRALNMDVPSHVLTQRAIDAMEDLRAVINQLRELNGMERLGVIE